MRQRPKDRNEVQVHLLASRVMLRSGPQLRRQLDTGQEGHRCHHFLKGHLKPALASITDFSTDTFRGLCPHVEVPKLRRRLSWCRQREGDIRDTSLMAEQLTTFEYQVGLIQTIRPLW